MRSTLIRSLAVAAALSHLLCQPARADDDLRIRQLEGEVSRLQREIATQARRIDELERAVRAAGERQPAVSARRPGGDSPAWLVTANWDRVKRGMKDVEVIALLGRPTSVRTDSDGAIRVLLYALELGPAAVLAGNIRLDASGVAEINRPTLR